MKQAFIERKFSAESSATIEMLNTILAEYEAQGYTLSLRQLYYQMVARGHLENSQRSYKNLGNLVSNARLAGLIDWAMIEDRGRSTVTVSHWKSPADIVQAAAWSFRIDKWADQKWHIEVMVEKDALSGVLEPVCRELDIAITANKGYSSSSTMYEIGQRFDRLYMRENKQICVIYLGDHDPSGIDMTRDIEERLTMFSINTPIDVVRLALNYDQVKLWNPPENPAKETDARFEAYAKKFGESSWELDAVEPATLADLVRDEVMSRRDAILWADAIFREEKMRAELRNFANNYKEE